MTLDIGLVILGLLLLTFGGDRLVLSAARISRHWGVSPVLIGALIVGMGTSAPELLVSVVASLRGGLDLAIGNVVGSNVANVSLVLGSSVLLAPISGATHVLRREGVLMLLGVALMTALTWDGELHRLEGVALLLGMSVAVFFMLRWAQVERASRVPEEVRVDKPGAEEPSSDGSGLLVELLLGLSSIAAVIVGAELLVRGAQGIAVALGLSQAIIGLTLVAVGTSLPELATAIAAAARRENDLLIGNVVGSNLFNSLAVVGAAGAVSPGQMDVDFRPVMSAMIGICVLAGLFVWTGDRVVRLEGAALLVAYAAFVYLSV